MTDHPDWLLEVVRPGDAYPDDAALMTAAIRVALANIGHTSGGPFAAIVTTAERRVVSLGYNSVVPSHDPTAHAEVLAIRAAGTLRVSHSLRGLRLFSTCAPCVMCAGAIHWARLSEVIAAARRTDAEAKGFIEGPAGFDVSAFLADRGIGYRADVERDAALEIFRGYHGALYNG
jgi:tRNA(Arg) A34 adenosine deaminase TadA